LEGSRKWSKNRKERRNAPEKSRDQPAHKSSGGQRKPFVPWERLGGGTAALKKRKCDESEGPLGAENSGVCFTKTNLTQLVPEYWTNDWYATADRVGGKNSPNEVEHRRSNVGLS